MGPPPEADYPEAIERILYQAWATRKRIAVLGCGSFAEADALTGRDLSNITVVETDAAALQRVKQRHGHQIVIVQQSNIEFLRDTIEARESFDLVYSLTLLEALDAQIAHPYLDLIRQSLKPQGAVYLWNVFRSKHAELQSAVH